MRGNCKSKETIDILSELGGHECSPESAAFFDICESLLTAAERMAPRSKGKGELELETPNGLIISIKRKKQCECNNCECEGENNG